MYDIVDHFDPNNWVEEQHEFRIYLDDNAQQYAIVDEIDYHWAIRWKWNIKRCKRLKEYARRAESLYVDGKRAGSRSIYLHIEIMKRTGVKPPTPMHTIVDHRNGRSLNCKRSNLRWATPLMNVMNINGSIPYDLFDKETV